MLDSEQGKEEQDKETDFDNTISADSNVVSIILKTLRRRPRASSNIQCLPDKLRRLISSPIN